MAPFFQGKTSANQQIRGNSAGGASQRRAVTGGTPDETELNSDDCLFFRQGAIKSGNPGSK
jgi:hypothetical protein